MPATADETPVLCLLSALSGKTPLHMERNRLAAYLNQPGQVKAWSVSRARGRFPWRLPVAGAVAAREGETTKAEASSASACSPSP